MTIRRTNWLGTLLLLALAACTTIGQAIVEKPKVDLDHIGIRDVSGSGATILFGLKVANPNPFALKVDHLHYDLELAGRPFSSGELERPAEVPAKDSAVVELPVPVKYSELFSSLLDLAQNQARPYRIKGEAMFGVLTVPFDEKGELKIR